MTDTDKDNHRPSGGRREKYTKHVFGGTTSYNEHDVLGPGPEAAESAKAWEECNKNPGHKNFIPLTGFGIHNLPEQWQREDLVQWIMAQSALTVRLRVFKTSPDRPEDGSYYGDGGGGVRVGTGFVFLVEPVPGPCPCARCKLGQKEMKMSWKIYTKTAKHVVFDDFEAANTWVDFFYDDVESRENGRMKSFRGEKVEYTIDDIDFCIFTFFCHDDDDDLASQLIEKLDERDTLWKGLKDWKMSLRPCQSVIVSHPHGRPKHVTMGQFEDADPTKNLQTRPISYTTDTCPGSSGAGGMGFWRTATEVGLFGFTHCQGGGSDGCNKGLFNVYKNVLTVAMLNE